MGKKMIVVLVTLLCLAGLGAGILGMIQHKENTTTDSKETAYPKKEKPAFQTELTVLDKEQPSPKEEQPNKIFSSDIEFSNADSTATFVYQANIINDKGKQYAGKDGKPLIIKKELQLGKENGKVHVVITANKPMMDHLRQLEHVQVTNSLKQQNPPSEMGV